jgi:hypothetical protein
MFECNIERKIKRTCLNVIERYSPSNMNEIYREPSLIKIGFQKLHSKTFIVSI